jgi:hypothetical protein
MGVAEKVFMWINRMVVEATTWKFVAILNRRRVKRREGKPVRSARAIRATDIHPTDASASTALAGEVEKARQL